MHRTAIPTEGDGSPADFKPSALGPHQADHVHLVSGLAIQYPTPVTTSPPHHLCCRIRQQCQRLRGLPLLSKQQTPYA